MARVEAVLFDLDGTLADTERDGHRPAFNATFAEHGLNWHWDEALYGRLLAITGGPAVVKAAMNSGKRAIAAGPGNPPAVVDETVRFEGESNPDDEAIVVAISTAHGHQGYIVAAYGADMEAGDVALLQALTAR